jgi:hypothetical protein
VKPWETHLGMVGNFGIWETKLEIWRVGGTPLKKDFGEINGNQKKSDEKSIDC